MAWTDKPTKAQITAIHRFMMWKMPTAKAIDAADWLEMNATRKEAADEMGRLRALYMGHKLTYEECFNSEVWKGYVARNNKQKEVK